jgi:hypothetical protein
LAKLAFGKAVIVEWHKRDVYGRLVGKVQADRQDVGLAQCDADRFGLQSDPSFGLGLGSGQPATLLTATTLAAAQSGYTINQATQAGSLFQNFTGPIVVATGAPYVIAGAVVSAPGALTAVGVFWQCTAPIRQAISTASKVWTLAKGVSQATLPPSPTPTPQAIVRFSAYSWD